MAAVIAPPAIIIKPRLHRTAAARRWSPFLPARILLGAVLLLLPLPGSLRLAAAAGCSMAVPEGGDTEACLCEDNLGSVFDMSGIQMDLNGRTEPTVVATGPCSGSATYCSGSWVHQLGICQNVPGVTATGGISSCTTTQSNIGFRLDTRAECPPSTGPSPCLPV
jgi:hypothetical protein